MEHKILQRICGRNSKYAWKEAVLCLDLKPDNISIDEVDKAVIGDFGLSNASTKKKGVYNYLTTDYGTPEFVAPEIWEGSEFNFGPDVFAFGVILYNVMTGRLPLIEDGTDLRDRIIALKYDITPLNENKSDKEEIKIDKRKVKELFILSMTYDRKERIQIWDVLGIVN